MKFKVVSLKSGKLTHGKEPIKFRPLLIIIDMIAVSSGERKTYDQLHSLIKDKETYGP